MSRKKKTDKEVSIVCSSAAEYLTFVAASGTGGVEAVYADESIWLTQKKMGVLYDVETQTVNYHLKTVFSDSELREESVIRNFRITAADGKTYNTKHYKLPAIIAVGYKVNSERAMQFRNAVLFAHRELKEMDKEDRARACYLHVCLRYVQSDFMTNTTLRERFGIEDKSSAMASRIIRDTIAVGLIRCHDETVGSKARKYLPWWA